MIDVIKYWSKVLNNHLLTTFKVVDELKMISDEYKQSNHNTEDIGFNVFKLSSDLYYRENFHSDIIKAFLDPSEKHNEGNKYLNIFVKMLGLCYNDYEYSNVIREENRIDILITNSNSGKAIIIENKINNAGDMPRQLPRYYDIVSTNYKIEAIVYIPLQKSKRPDRATWTEQDNINVLPLLKIIPSFDVCGDINLVDNWIIPSLVSSANIDNISILKQYSKLIKYLNTSIMDTTLYEKFYDSIKTKENLETLVSLVDMTNNLPTYLAIRIENKYKDNSHPFNDVFRYKDIDTVLGGFKINNFVFKIDVWCSLTGYKVYFWEANGNHDMDIKKYFADIECLKDFEYDNGNMYSVLKIFKPLDENAVCEFINQIRKGLKDRYVEQ